MQHVSKSLNSLNSEFKHPQCQNTAFSKHTYSAGSPCAVEFTPWAEWLSMAVFIDNELKPIPDADVIAHVLYEITWGGWTEEDAQETVAELNLAHTEAMDELSSCVDVDKD